MRKFKKPTINYNLFIILFFLFPSITQAVSPTKIQGIFNGEKTNKILFYETKDTEYFSIRNIAELCGADLYWYSITGKVVFKINNQNIVFYFNSRKININSQQINFIKPTLIFKDVTYIPLEFLESKYFKNLAKLNCTFNRNSKLLILESITNVLNPRIYEEPGLTKIIFELTEDLKYSINSDFPKNVTINFYKGFLEKNEIEYNGYLLKNIKLYNENNTGICKLFLRNNIKDIKNEYVTKPDYKLIIKIYGEKPEEITEISSETTVGLTTFYIQDKQNLQKRKIKIVLDPGHGGEDPGAVGPNNIKEKDLNLNIALYLKDLFDKEKFDVFLTREEDVFIPLIDRTNFANEKNADIFISIHCNASPNKNKKGFEIYFLSEKASDPEALATQNLENSVVKLEGPPTEEKIKLQEILWSMATVEFMNESSKLCYHITQNVVKRLKLENRGIKQAGFFVLRGASMPAVLVECGFITNPIEEAKLNMKNFQKQIADSIYNGLQEYLKNYE